MNIFKITYSFDGQGEVFIDANSESEAEAKFYSGEFSGEKETGQNYSPEFIQKVKTKKNTL
jgi:hypothetical protein